MDWTHRCGAVPVVEILLENDGHIGASPETNRPNIVMMFASQSLGTHGFAILT